MRSGAAAGSARFSFSRIFKAGSDEADWGDVTFLTEHDKDIAKIAVVGEEEWRDMLTPFSPKGFAKPKSNISFLAIWQKRALGTRHGTSCQTRVERGVWQ